jgi:hypothetical protein
VASFFHISQDGSIKIVKALDRDLPNGFPKFSMFVFAKVTSPYFYGGASKNCVYVILVLNASDLEWICLHVFSKGRERNPTPPPLHAPLSGCEISTSQSAKPYHMPQTLLLSTTDRNCRPTWHKFQPQGGKEYTIHSTHIRNSTYTHLAGPF